MELFATRVIGRPASEVAEFFFDATNNPSWQKGMRHCEWTTAGPITVGSENVQEAAFMGRPIRSRFRVTDYTPRRTMTIDTVEGTFPIRVTRTVEESGPDSCRVTARISGGPGGVFKLASPIFRRIAQRSVDNDYDRLVARFT